MSHRRIEGERIVKASYNSDKPTATVGKTTPGDMSPKYKFKM
jgi:hypothetical protein